MTFEFGLLGALAFGVFFLAAFVWLLKDYRAIWWAFILVAAWFGGDLRAEWFPVINTLGLAFSLTLLQLQRVPRYGLTITALFAAQILLDIGYSSGLAGSGRGYYWALLVAYGWQLFALGLGALSVVWSVLFKGPCERQIRRLDRFGRIWALNA